MSSGVGRLRLPEGVPSLFDLIRFINVSFTIFCAYPHIYFVWSLLGVECLNSINDSFPLNQYFFVLIDRALVAIYLLLPLHGIIINGPFCYLRLPINALSVLVVLRILLIGSFVLQGQLIVVCWVTRHTIRTVPGQTLLFAGWLLPITSHRIWL